MWKEIASRWPTTETLVYAALSALVPWVVYTVNKKIHKYGDPPWKKE